MTYEKAHQEAARRLRNAKERVDEAQAALDKAEDEWHQACREIDRLDGVSGENRKEP